MNKMEDDPDILQALDQTDRKWVNLWLNGVNNIECDMKGITFRVVSTRSNTRKQNKLRSKSAVFFLIRSLVLNFTSSFY